MNEANFKSSTFETKCFWIKREKNKSGIATKITTDTWSWIILDSFLFLSYFYSQLSPGESDPIETDFR